MSNLFLAIWILEAKREMATRVAAPEECVDELERKLRTE